MAESFFLLISCLADLVFDPTLALTRFAEDLLLRYAMITARSLAYAAYVDPFARTWPGLATTDLSNIFILFIILLLGK